nr:MAG TPA: hypothetical protein [Caudoviricetes sp.]
MLSIQSGHSLEVAPLSSHPFPPYLLEADA